MFNSFYFSQTKITGHPQPSTGVEICYNDKGDIVKHGEQYVPLGIDTCTQVCLIDLIILIFPENYLFFFQKKTKSSI